MPLMVDRVCANPACALAFKTQASRIPAGRGVYCSRRCLGVVNAKRNHETYAFTGVNNPNFKGWRSRDKRAYVDRFRQKYPEKALAHDVVEWGIRTGRLVKPECCERCGLKPTEPLHSHHEDYTRPLMVMFLCRPCHHVLDAERRLRLEVEAKHIPEAVLALGLPSVLPDGPESVNS